MSGYDHPSKSQVCHNEQEHKESCLSNIYGLCKNCKGDHPALTETSKEEKEVYFRVAGK